MVKLQAESGVLSALHNTEITGRQWCSCSYPAQSWGYKQRVVFFLLCTRLRLPVDSNLVPTLHNAEVTGRQWSCSYLPRYWNYKQTVVFLFLPCTMLMLQADSTVSNLLPGGWNLNTELYHDIASTITTQSSICSAPMYKFLKRWVDIILDTHTYIVRSFFLCICLSGCVSSCVLQVCKNLWKTQLVLDSLGLELQRFVSNHVSARGLLQEQEVLITAGLYLYPLML